MQDSYKTTASINFGRSNFRPLDRSKFLATLVWRILFIVSDQLLYSRHTERHEEKGNVSLYLPLTHMFLGVRHAFPPHEPVRTFAWEARSLLASDWVGVVSTWPWLFESWIALSTG